jgi:hypothetical protein
MKDSTIKRARDANSDLKTASYRISSIADCFKHIGMGDAAAKLHDIADCVLKSGEELYLAWSDEFNHHCDYVEESAVSTLKAALAGVRLADDLESEEEYE